ncbi:MAG TPA: FtsX-like permease family protein [Bacteroidales bacterium]|nr:FtsX-like permease family protein [Bacteroidales bacterium]
MIASDFKSALRNISHNKTQSAISILGLGIGLGCIILLLALVVHEKSFDRFIPDSQNVFRIMFGESSSSQYPLTEEMKAEFPEVIDYFRFYQTNEIQLRNQKHDLVRDQYFGFSDPSIFNILGIRLIAGVASNSLSEVAISEKTAIKYFGNSSPLGIVLSVKLNDEFLDLSICGVYKDFPSTSTLFPRFIANIKLSEKMFREFQRSLGDYGNDNKSTLNWDRGNFLSYLVLDRNADITGLASKMAKYKELINNERTKDFNYSLQPVTDIYLRSGAAGGSQFTRSGNPNELKYYEIIALLILLISITNYILLTRAATSGRLRELGTRKIVGASQGTIRRKIILESILVTLLSLIPAALIVRMGINFVDNILEKSLSIQIFSNPFMWLLLLSVVLFTAIISGVIIGYNISRILSLLLLAGKTSELSRSGKWKYSFLIFHFTIYVILVVCVLSVSKQIKYSLTNFKGINPEHILISELNSEELKSGFVAICNEMKKIPGVIMTAGSSFIPPFGAYLPVTLATPEGEKVRFDGLIMGEGMTEMLGIEVIDGESFGPFNPDRREVLFNESSALKHNVKAGEQFLAFNVKGIVKDFHAHSLHRLIQPMVILQQNPSSMGLLAIKTDGTNDEAIIKQLRGLYNQISPNEIFEVSYLTDQVGDFYKNEKNQGKIIGAFSLLATILSIMGLFGIALISISKKTKEIGLRKVNGASVAEVLYLLNIDFIKWVLISFFISIPASLYIISEWQSRFAYKTELSWWIFATAGLSAIIIALLTVSWQSWQAATRNPVEAIRYE